MNRVADTFLERLRALPRWLRWGGAVVGVLLLAALLFRRPLADRLYPETRAQALREQAAVALAHGRLSAADGTGARELYEAALAIDPDRNEARRGLGRVAGAALAQARAATASGRFADAHEALSLARALSAPRAAVDAAATRLREAEAARAGIDGMLARAADARAAGRLDGAPDAALPLYQRVLTLQPDRLEALEGREDTLADLLQQARRALQHDDLAGAAALVAAARGYDPGHADLPDTQARFAAALDRARRTAARDLRRGRLQAAGERYALLARLAPDDPEAARGIEAVAVAWARRAERDAADFRFADAEAALARARALAPQAHAVAEAGRHVARARQVQARLGPTLSPAARARRVRTLLAEAAAAQARGDLLTPPGDSAFDKLRAAQALSPTEPAVRRAAARLVPAARDCFERELRANALGRARACLDARAALEGASADVAAARQRLAQRWLAVGAERLGAGELDGAASALAAARALDPATPGLEEFSSRLRTATASGD